MERLTNKDLTKACNDPWDYCGLDSVCKRDCHKPTPCKIPKIVHRLAEIEDILGDEYDTDRLAEIVRAEKEGRCVVLPCKVGDMVYSAFPLCGVNSHQIRKIEIDADGGFACSALMIPFSDFGKTVFLAREEAEAKLKERENNG